VPLQSPLLLAIACNPPTAPPALTLTTLQTYHISPCILFPSRLILMALHSQKTTTPSSFPRTIVNQQVTVAMKELNLLLVEHPFHPSFPQCSLHTFLFHYPDIPISITTTISITIIIAIIILTTSIRVTCVETRGIPREYASLIWRADLKKNAPTQNGGFHIVKFYSRGSHFGASAKRPLFFFLPSILLLLYERPL
jgi:hypothetical protein